MIGHIAGGARLVQRALAPRAIILLYHRIADIRPDPWSLMVSPQHFAEHIEILRGACTPLGLRDLVAGLSGRPMPRRTVVVTFDDGYADNLLAARPVLERYAVPATVFTTTGALNRGGEFWWDELEGLLLRPGTLPAAIEIEIAGAHCHWELGAAAVYSTAAAAEARRWIAWGYDHPTPRHVLYHDLWELLHPLPEPDRQQVLATLRQWAGVPALARPTHRALRIDELRALAQGNLVEIGAHTVTHPTLAALSPAAQRDEIAHSKAWLEQILDRPVTSFSYPFGRKTDYTAETISHVQAAGFHCACANFAGSTGRRTDPFELPRFNVPDIDGAAFERQLAAWFAA